MIRHLRTLAARLDHHASSWILLAGAIVGVTCFSYYYTHGLTTAHYDAKAHLVVARKIIDSAQPGYGQIGINWLPLIHLIYLPIVAFESQYRSGFLPSLISVCAFALSGWLVYRISYRLTGSSAAGVFAGIVLLANPNLEYLQSCPLTEPLYMVLLLLATDSLISWRESDVSTLPWMPAVWAALGALCRYEGWYFVGGVMLLLAYDFWTRYIPRRRALHAGIVYIATFGMFSGSHFFYIYARLGDSFLHKVAEGNPAPYETYKRPLLSLFYHLGEISQIAAIVPLIVGVAGLLFCLAQRNKLQRRAPLLLLWLPSLINISALYWGLIYRLRYSVLLLPAVAIFGGLVITSAGARKRTLILASAVAMVLPWLSWYFPPEWRFRAFFPGPGSFILPSAALVLFLIARAKEQYRPSLLLLCVLGMQIPVLAGEYHPIMAETLEHEFIEPERQEVLQYLRRHYDGRRILIDMGKLAPLVYDSGLPIKDFIYNEGEEALWRKAIRHPEEEVGWLCAEKGDEIWERLQLDHQWADGYSLALKTENFIVYRLKSKERGALLPARQLE